MQYDNEQFHIDILWNNPQAPGIMTEHYLFKHLTDLEIKAGIRLLKQALKAWQEEVKRRKIGV